MILSKINLKLLVETLKQTTYCLYYVKLCSIWLEKNIYSILCHQGINNVYEGKKRIQKFYLSKKFISPIILGAQVIVTREYQILVFFFFFFNPLSFQDEFPFCHFLKPQLFHKQFCFHLPPKLLLFDSSHLLWGKKRLIFSDDIQSYLIHCFLILHLGTLHICQVLMCL